MPFLGLSRLPYGKTAFIIKLAGCRTAFSAACLERRDQQDMGLQKKIALWSLGVLSLIAAFFLSVLVLAPLYLNTLSTKEKIETAISRQLGGSVRYQRLTIALWPLPHVIFHEARLSIPKTASGTLKIISIYPQLFPLMKGDLLFSRILVQEPDLSIALPETVQAVQPEALSLPEVKRNVLLVLKYLTAIGPGLVVEMDQGAIKFTRKSHLLLFLQDAAVRFNAPPGTMDITLRAHAEPWGAFSMSGKYSFNDDKAEVKDLALTAGRSALSGFSAGLSWKNAPRLNVISGRATFALAELYQWLSSSGTLTAYVNDVRSLSGEVTLASVQADVPLYHLADSKMTIAGKAGNVTLDWGPLPAPLSVTGQFIVEENRLMVSDFSAHLGASALSRISASLSDRKQPRYQGEKRTGRNQPWRGFSLGQKHRSNTRYVEQGKKPDRHHQAFVPEFQRTALFAPGMETGAFRKPRTYRVCLAASSRSIRCFTRRLHHRPGRACLHQSPGFPP